MTDLMMRKEDIEKEKLRLLKKKLVSNARAILTNQIGLPLGVQKMTKIVTWIVNIQPLDFDVKLLRALCSRSGGPYNAPFVNRRMSLPPIDYTLKRLKSATKR
jgi:hypothetical protein